MLAAFLRKSLGEPFVWGQRDCALWAADWIKERRGVDPATSIRGRYSTRLGCERFANRHGGLPAYADEILTGAGLERTDDPQPGDVGLIDTPDGPTVAVRVDLGWAIKAARGIKIVPARHLMAWRV